MIFSILKRSLKTPPLPQEPQHRLCTADLLFIHDYVFYVWVSHGAIQLPNNHKPARIKCCWFDTPRYFTSLRVTHSINCSIDIIDWFAKSLSQDDLPIEQREYIQSIGSKMIIFVDKVSVTWLYPLNILRNWVHARYYWFDPPANISHLLLEFGTKT